ncbi:hypothetical protein CL629_01685 [bacterium]|nr:hypothetical protein [bacterium]|tara:strand:+ start:298 stop:2025 length:1728 start_codon:yes stop_codon:yes gene_type:complete
MAKAGSTKKLFLEAEDDIDEALERISAFEGKNVVLNIPKGSVLGGSVKNFRFLRKKTDELEKNLVIESVDDHVLELAEVADIDAVNPVFRTKGKAVVDIVPGGSGESRSGRSKKTEKISLQQVKEEEVEEEEGEEEPDAEPEEKAEDVVQDEIPQKVVHFWERDRAAKAPQPAKMGFLSFLQRGKKSKGGIQLPSARFVRFAVVFLVIIALGWGLATILPKATITLALKRYPVSFVETVKVDTKTPLPSFAGETVFLPGELLTAVKNLEMSFPATGEDEVERKATGKIKIFNEFSSKSQALVARTRFETPDGLVYRLFEQVTVPGADVVEGEIEASSIEVEVYADEAGEEYNIGPVPKFTIPGFKGGPRYDGFYAASVGSMKGGFVGVQRVPTDADLEVATETITDSLLDSLEGELAILMSDSFKVFDDTTLFQIVREEVYPPSPGEEMFSVFVEGQLQQFVFREDDLEEALVGRAKESLTEDVSFNVDDFSVEFTDLSVDLSAERLQFGVEGEAVFIADIDSSGLTAELLGKSSEDVKKEIFKLPGLDRARVSLWPFWVKKVPGKEGKVTIEVE